jgi:hypothetical protein
MLLILISLFVAGVALSQGYPDVAWGFLWGAALGEVNIQLLRRRLLSSRDETREAAGKRLFGAFIARYVIIIAGVLFGAFILKWNPPAILIGLIVGYGFGVARVARTGKT